MISHALDPVFLLFGAAAFAVLICALLGVRGVPKAPPEPVAPPAPLRPAGAPVPRRFGYGAVAYGENPFEAPPAPPAAVSPMARASGSGDLTIGALAGAALGFTAAQVALLNADAPFVLRDAAPDCSPVPAAAAPAAADCGCTCGAD